MNTTIIDKAENNENTIVVEFSENESGVVNCTNDDQVLPKKNYHYSALYAASLCHNPVNHVKHEHRGLNL
jgi:hypothetical protein